MSNEIPILQRFRIIRCYHQCSRWNMNTPTCTIVITWPQWSRDALREAENVKKETYRETDRQADPLPSDCRELEMGIFVSNSFMYPFVPWFINLKAVGLSTSGWHFNGPSITQCHVITVWDHPPPSAAEKKKKKTESNKLAAIPEKWWEPISNSKQVQSMNVR